MSDATPNLWKRMFSFGRQSRPSDVELQNRSSNAPAVLDQPNPQPDATQRNPGTRSKKDNWRPWSLRRRFLFFFATVLLVIVALLLVSMWYVNTHKKGISPVSSSSYMHYAWTVPPPLIGTLISFVVAEIAFKAQRLMPWFAMHRKPQPYSRSVGLDYLDDVTFLVPWYSLKNKHWLVVFCSIAALLANALSPSLAPILFLEDAVTNTPTKLWMASRPGLVHWWNSLEGFYSAMSGMSSSIRDSQGVIPADSPWVSSDGWAIGTFAIPNSGKYSPTTNISLNVPVIYHTSGCEITELNTSYITHSDSHSSFNITAVGTKSGCKYSFTLDVSSSCCDNLGNGCCDNWAGNTTSCGRTQPDGSPLHPSQQPFVFWTGRMISRTPTALPNVSVTICTPGYKIYPKAEVIVNAKTNAIMSVTLSNETMPDPPLQVDPILNGSAFNGLDLTYINHDDYNLMNDRRAAIRAGLLTAIIFKGEKFTDPYADNGYFNITNSVYTSYLAHIAHEVYFTLPNTSFVGVPDAGNATVFIQEHELKLFVNQFSAYFSAGLLAIIAIALFATAILLGKMSDLIIPEKEGMIHTIAYSTKDGSVSNKTDRSLYSAIPSNTEQDGRHVLITVVPNS